MIVLDTHAWLWSFVDSGRLSRRAAAAIRRTQARGERPILSAISLAEVAALVRAGKVTAGEPFAFWIADAIERTSIQVHDITVEVAARLLEIGDAVRNPADRLIVATALELGASLVTKDEPIREAGIVRTIW